MDQLTLLEKAAGDYVAKYGADNALLRINAFEAGAEWQKEQDKPLIKALQDAIKFIKCSPFLSNPEKHPKGLEKWEALIERLQD
jgi:hypothetical protein